MRVSRKMSVVLTNQCPSLALLGAKPASKLTLHSKASRVTASFGPYPTYEPLYRQHGPAVLGMLARCTVPRDNFPTAQICFLFF